MHKCDSLLDKIACVVARKKKETKVYTPEQQLALRKDRDHFTESIAANMKIFLRGSIGHALLLFKMAIDGKGYIDAKYLDNTDVFLGLGEETEEAGVGNDNENFDGTYVDTHEAPTQLKGAIEKATLRNYLVPAEVYSKGVPKSISSIAATLMDPGLALAVLDVMCALLNKTEAWTVFDKKDVTVDRDFLSSVKPALIALGVKSEMAEKFWQKTILDPYLTQIESDSVKFMPVLQHRIKECLDGNYANLKPAIIAELLSGFPGKKKVEETSRHVL